MKSSFASQVNPEGLCAEMSHHSIAEVVEPVIVVGVAGQWMLCPVVITVDVVPQEWNDMKRPMHPVHAEGHKVVVGHEAKRTLMKRCDHTCRSWVVPRNGIVEPHVKCELAQQGQAVVEEDGLQLFHVAAAEILLLLERMLTRWLGTKSWEGEEHSLQVRVVEPGHGGLWAQGTYHGLIEKKGTFIGFRPYERIL